MDKISGYIVENGKGGYDVITKTSQTKPFVIPTEESTQKTENNSNAENKAKANPFTASAFAFKDWQSQDMQMYTKTEPARSDDEIIKDIVALAKKHAQQGTDRSKDKEEWFALMKEYTSSVSPDREGILNRTINEIIGSKNQGEDNYSMFSAFQQADSQRTREDKEDKKESIDYFIEALKNRGKGNTSVTRQGNYYIVNTDYGNGMKSELTYDLSGQLLVSAMSGNNYTAGGEGYGGITNATIKDDDGNIIATYFDKPNQFGGLHSMPTQAEWARMQEIAAVYNSAYDFSVGRYNPPPYEYGNKDKELYESTYKMLRNEVA